MAEVDPLPTFIDLVRWGDNKLGINGAGDTEHEALLPMLDALRSGSKAGLPSHAVFVNCSKSVDDEKLLDYLIMTSPLMHAVYQMGRNSERRGKGRRT